MNSVKTSLSTRRYNQVSAEKSHGATYTPEILAEFVAEKIVEALNQNDVSDPVRVLDPAVGEGQLLMSLVGQLRKIGRFRN